MGMSRLAYALAGILVANLAAAPAVAGSVSSRLTVTVTVVEPGTLGGTNLPAESRSAPGAGGGQPTPPPDGPATSGPRLDTVPPAQ
jgi:hypothetical protein